MDVVYATHNDSFFAFFSCIISIRNGLNSASIRHEVNDELISNIEYTSVIYTRYQLG